MTRVRVTLIALAGMAAFWSGQAHCGNAAGTFPVSSAVLSSCTMGTLNNVVFPPYSVFGSGALNANATFQFTCTKGTTFTSVDLVAASGAVGARKMSNGASTIGYELYQPSGDGAAATCPNTATWGAGTPVGAGKGYKPVTVASRNIPTTLKVCGVISSQGADIPAGTYIDTVTVNVNYN
jgi:spore coat protein U-like protein